MDESSGVEEKVERVVFETDRHRIVGDVALPPKGYQSRVSDLLNREDLAFISLVNAEIAPLAGGGAERHPFLALGKTHVRVAYPLPASE